MTRNRIIVLVAVLTLVLGCLTLAGCGSSDEAEAAFAVGDQVAAEWTDGRLYLAEVTAVSDDGMVTVTYLDDDSEGELEEAQVFAIEETEWEVGDRVLAVWAVAKFYSGTIDGMEGSDYVVSWDDGSEPSAVSPDMIIAYDAKYGDDPAE